MDKREMIERVLLALVGIADDAPLILHGYFLEVVKTLAEQAIVIECDVRHHKLPKEEFTTIHINGDYLAEPCVLVKPGIIGGTPGKYIFFGLPLEEG